MPRFVPGTSRATLLLGASLTVPEQQFIVSRVRMEISTLSAPVDVCDVAGVTPADSLATVTRHLVDVYDVFMAADCQLLAVRRILDVTNFPLAFLLLCYDIPGGSVEHFETAILEAYGDLFGIA
eukprot:CAMPEP_0201281514 /NCGR_PEP_ID=MMETSP1317-20130820/3050_1 /ASSEMBLY_ACC=CAM_ASM_000770 /TAXON_ID=187299 /ORGANISM="Undescribed Undescribed, Strain Undescribed" /LENGTH=123 /DNA_ID=CAMNT_0047591491 /DNA_START=352 /DNA_END=723 /DNA_ORIENTATION=-